MRISALALALLLPACMVTGEIEGVGGDDEGGGGGGGGGGGDGSGSGSGSNTNTPRITASIDKATVSTELGKTETVAVTINSVNAFTGAVTLTPSVMDGTTALTGWTITATPPSVDLTADSSQTVMLSVKVPTDTAALAPTLNIDLASSAPAVSVTSALTVANQVTVSFTAGMGAGAPHQGLPSPNTPLRIRAGAKIVFQNSDTIQHVIHADGGINHQNTGQGQPGTAYTVTPDDSATWYCHSHEGGGTARPVLLVQ
ncbi:MAG TPA: hypothetical protein VIV11_41130 [Kofleriaceae bacterium]